MIKEFLEIGMQEEEWLWKNMVSLFVNVEYEIGASGTPKWSCSIGSLKCV